MPDQRPIAALPGFFANRSHEGFGSRQRVLAVGHQVDLVLSPDGSHSQHLNPDLNNAKKWGRINR